MVKTQRIKRQVQKEKSWVPRISFDYFFFSQEDDQANKHPMIVMVDDETGEKYARGVSQKGMGEDGEMKWLIDDMQRDLKSWGHPGGESNHMIFKTDGEASIKVVRNRLARQLGGEVVTESPAQGESQSNGLVEEAGKTVREFVRVFKDVIETKTRAKVKKQRCDPHVGDPMGSNGDESLLSR